MNKAAIAGAFGGALLAHAALAAPACPARTNSQPDAAWNSAVGDYCQASWAKTTRSGTYRARFLQDCLRRCQTQAKRARPAHSGASSGPILAAGAAAAGVSAAVAAAHMGEKPASP